MELVTTVGGNDIGKGTIEAGVNGIWRLDGSHSFLDILPIRKREKQIIDLFLLSYDLSLSSSPKKTYPHLDCVVSDNLLLLSPAGRKNPTHSSFPLHSILSAVRNRAAWLYLPPCSDLYSFQPASVYVILIHHRVHLPNVSSTSNPLITPFIFIWVLSQSPTLFMFALHPNISFLAALHVHHTSSYIQPIRPIGIQASFQI